MERITKIINEYDESKSYQNSSTDEETMLLESLNC